MQSSDMTEYVTQNTAQALLRHRLKLYSLVLSQRFTDTILKEPIVSRSWSWADAEASDADWASFYLVHRALFADLATEAASAGFAMRATPLVPRALQERWLTLETKLFQARIRTLPWRQKGMMIRWFLKNSDEAIRMGAETSPTGWEYIPRSDETAETHVYQIICAFADAANAVRSMRTKPSLYEDIKLWTAMFGQKIREERQLLAGGEGSELEKEHAVWIILQNVNAGFIERMLKSTLIQDYPHYEVSRPSVCCRRRLDHEVALRMQI